MDRLEQPQVIVMVKGLDGNVRQLGEVANFYHESTCVCLMAISVHSIDPPVWCESRGKCVRINVLTETKP